MSLEGQQSHEVESGRSKSHLEFKTEDKRPILEIDKGTTLAEYFEYMHSKRFGPATGQADGGVFSLDDFEDDLEDGLQELAGEDDVAEAPTEFPGLEENPAGQAFYRGYYSDGSELQDALEALERKINEIKSKNPSELTEEDKKLLKLTVLDFFKSEGFTQRTLKRVLPFRFRK